MFTFFLFLTSISTIEKQKASQAIDSVNEKFKGKNISDVEPFSDLQKGQEEGGDYDQKVKGLFQNIMPEAVFETQGKGEIVEIKLPITKIINNANPPQLLTNSSILFEKLAFLVKEKINNDALELTIFIGKSDISSNNINDDIFYDQKNGTLLLGQIARHFEKYGISKQILSIGFNPNLKNEISFQFRMAAQKPPPIIEIRE
jgi:hypothetical protein